MRRSSVLLITVLSTVLLAQTVVEARGRRPNRGTQVWKQIVRDKTVTQLRSVMMEQPTARWSRGKVTMKLGDLQAIAPQINQAFKGGNWNPTVRKQLRRINKMDHVRREGDCLIGTNWGRKGHVTLERSIKWNRAAAGPEVVTQRGDGLKSVRINYDGNPYSRGTLQVYVTTPTIGKRLPRGLRKLMTDTTRNRNAEVSRLPTTGDRIHYNTSKQRGGTHTVETSVMSPKDRYGLRDNVLRLTESR